MAHNSKTKNPRLAFQLSLGFQHQGGRVSPMPRLHRTRLTRAMRKMLSVSMCPLVAWRWWGA